MEIVSTIIKSYEYPPAIIFPFESISKELKAVSPVVPPRSIGNFGV